MFGSEVETTRADASIGLLLTGQENGTFKSMDLLESGLFIPYDVKDIQPIKVGTKTYYLVASNNDKLRCIATIHE